MQLVIYSYATGINDEKTNFLVLNGVKWTSKKSKKNNTFSLRRKSENGLEVLTELICRR